MPDTKPPSPPPPIPTPSTNYIAENSREDERTPISGQECTQASLHQTPNIPTSKYMQEGNITEECEALISTLPRDQGWSNTNLLYQGFWLSSRALQGVLNCQAHFQARDTDILLSTTPKSGTTWLKALLFALTNRATWPVGDPSHPLLAANPHDLVPFLELGLYADDHEPDLTGLPSPRVFATQIPVGSLPRSVEETGCKVVYLCRDPKDTFISLWHFANKIKPPSRGDLSFEDSFDKFCKGVSIYGPFWEHVLGYWKHSLEKPSKILFLKYEDLKEQPKVHLRRLAEFCGCPFSALEENQGVDEEILKLCSFDKLSILEVNKRGRTLFSGGESSSFFRKGEVGDWANHFTPEMAKRIETTIEEKLHACGVSF